MKDFGFDPERALQFVRQAVAEAPAQLADGFGRLVRELPAERLDQLMRSPARKPILDGIFWQLPRQIDAAQAAGVSTSIRWCLTGRPDGGSDVYQLDLVDGRPNVGRGAGEHDPRLTITLDATELLQLVSGNSNPMQAYFAGRIKLSGDLMLAARLASLFRLPGQPPPSPHGAGPAPGWGPPARPGSGPEPAPPPGPEPSPQPGPGPEPPGSAGPRER